MSDSTLSTTALARKLGMSSRRLFILLKDYDWIARENERWVLLDKGVEQGGEYIDSKSYGQYVVWPEALVKHPLLNAAADAAQITASGIGDHFGRSARYSNRVLRELGWLRRTEKGWLLTEMGNDQGATQLKAADGMLYASWPKSVLSEPALIASFHAINRRRELAEAERDLFSDDGETELAGQKAFQSLDGHVLANAAETELCQCLYLLDLSHAYQRSLAGHDRFRCDFYLPRQAIYIDIWYTSESAERLAERFEKQEWCKEHAVTLIDIHEDEIAHLDELLPKKLKEFGISVY